MSCSKGESNWLPCAILECVVLVTGVGWIENEFCSYYLRMILLW